LGINIKYSPAAGKKFLVVHLLIQNTGSVEIKTGLNPRLLDDEGNEYKPFLEYHHIPGMYEHNEEVLSGKPYKGFVFYEVNTSAKGLYIIWHPVWFFNDAKVAIELIDRPTP